MVVSELSRVEVFATLRRALTTGRLDHDLGVAIASAYHTHRRGEYIEVRIGGGVMAIAEALVNRRLLRTLDAIQLASAFDARERYHELQFWTADRRQADAAVGEGLDVVFVG